MLDTSVPQRQNFRGVFFIFISRLEDGVLSNAIFDCFVLKKGKGFGGIVDFFHIETVVDHWLVALLTACWRFRKPRL